MKAVLCELPQVCRAQQLERLVCRAEHLLQEHLLQEHLLVDSKTDEKLVFMEVPWKGLMDLLVVAPGSGEKLADSKTGEKLVR